MSSVPCAARPDGSTRRGARPGRSWDNGAIPVSEATLNRTTFRTSRLLDFASEKELVAQIGHATEAWPLVILKELVDNAIDACEEAGIAPGGRSHGRAQRDHRRGQRPGHPGRDVIERRPRLLGPGQLARGLRQPDPRCAGQRAQDDRRDAVRPRRHAGRTVIETRGAAPPDRPWRRPHPSAADRRAPRRARRCRCRDPGHR